MPRLGFVLLLVACHPPTPVGTSGNSEVPRDAANQCKQICTNIGLGLDSVVVMANNVGCVCKAIGSSATAGGAGGMTAILLQQEAAMAAANASKPK